MEHLLNCHGEWAAVMAAFSSFTTYKIYFNFYTTKRKNNESKN